MIKLKRLAIAGVIATAITSPGAMADGADFEFDHVSCSDAENQIRIIVSGVEDSLGLMVADLYPNDEEKFLKGSGRILQVKFAARAPKTQFCITAPEPGNYAIAVYHDENANLEFDKGAFGLPAEPWGISNNPKVRFSAPGVDQALFEVASDGAEVAINLN